MPAGTEARLQTLGISVPNPPAPGGSYLSAKTAGPVIYLPGVVSTSATGVITGTACVDGSIADGYVAARACPLTLLAVLRQHLGTLDMLRDIIAVHGYVNAVAGFADSPQVVNGASDLLVEVFGDAGRSTRATIRVSALPGNALLEVEMAVEV